MNERERRHQIIRSMEGTERITEENREKEQRRMMFDKSPWPQYAYSVGVYDRQGSNPISIVDIKGLMNEFAERKKNGERILVVDVFGNADAASIGADHTIGFTLTEQPGMKDTPTHTTVVGNIFESKTRTLLNKTIDAQHMPITCAFFAPYYGPIKYADRPDTHVRLYSVLRDMYARLAKDGKIFIYAPGFDLGLSVLRKGIDSLSKEKICIDSAYDNELGIVKSADAPPTLPPLSAFPIQKSDLKELEAMYDLMERVDAAELREEARKRKLNRDKKNI